MAPVSWGPFRSFLSSDSSLLELKLVTTTFVSLHFLCILDAEYIAYLHERVNRARKTKAQKNQLTPF